MIILSTNRFVTIGTPCRYTRTKQAKKTNKTPQGRKDHNPPVAVDTPPAPAPGYRDADATVTTRVKSERQVYLYLALGAC